MDLRRSPVWLEETRPPPPDRFARERRDLADLVRRDQSLALLAREAGGLVAH